MPTSLPDNLRPSVLVSGFATTEAPRWRDDRLYFSDMAGHTVQTVTEQGVLTHVVEVPGTPGGLGWLPDGRLLVVSQTTREVLRLEPGGLVVHADLNAYGDSPLNDLWVDERGRAYVGEMGFNIHAFFKLQPAEMAEFIKLGRVFLVEADGTTRSATSGGLLFPNGIVPDPTTGRVVVAESFKLALSSFDVDATGALVDGELFAQLDFAPDGIVFDAEGNVWVADPVGKRAVYVSAAGAVLGAVELDRMCLSVALGGTDGRTLFICTSSVTDPDDAQAQRGSRIEVVRLPPSS